MTPESDATDPETAPTCLRCGYSLYGLPKRHVCPECGLPTDTCDYCGADVTKTPDHVPCPACGRQPYRASERQLVLSLLLPWRPPMSGFWLRPTSHVGTRFKARAVTLCVGMFLLGVAASSTGLRCIFHHYLRDADGPVWSWRGDMLVCHWGIFLEKSGGVLSSRLSDYRAKNALQLLPHQRPKRNGDPGVRTFYADTSLELALRTDVLLLLLPLASSSLALFLVAAFGPSPGLWLATRPGGRMSLLRRGCQRLRWAILAAVFCQGVLLVCVGVYDPLSFYVRWPFVGIRSFGLELLLPLLVFEYYVLRAVRMDLRGCVFRSRAWALFQPALGCLLTLSLVLALTLFF
ncbi:MAG: hypothetical protein JSU68_08485, partial [Phycisphaerales bacterium]